MNNDVRIGKRVREARVDAKITQAQLADRLGISRPAVSQWENGKSDPTHENLVAIASLTGKPLSWFHVKSDDQAMKLANSAIADATVNNLRLLPRHLRLVIDRKIARANAYAATLPEWVLETEIPVGHDLEELLDRIEADMDAMPYKPR